MYYLSLFPLTGFDLPVSKFTFLNSNDFNKNSALYKNVRNECEVLKSLYLVQYKLLIFILFFFFVGVAFSELNNHLGFTHLSTNEHFIPTPRRCCKKSSITENSRKSRFLYIFDI